MKKKILMLSLIVSIALWAKPPLKIEKNSVDCNTVPFDYGYKYIESDAGDKFTIEENEYIMVSVPFIEFGSGDPYYIKFPQDTKETYWITVNISYLKSTDSCYSDTFSNFPAKFDDFTYNTFYHKTSSYDADHNLKVYFMVSQNVQVSTYIKMNETVIYISAMYQEKINQKNPLAIDDIDLVDNIDWSKVEYNTRLIENLKKILNHIKIEKAEK